MAWPTSDFPTSIDTIANKTDSVDDVDAADINGGYDCIEKLEAKVGVNTSGVSSSLDYQLNNASSVNPGHLHTFATGLSALTISRATETDGSGKVVVSAVTSTELNYLDGVTSDIQTQFGAKLENIVEDTTPQLGGNLDMNEKGIAYDFASLVSDHIYSGDVITATPGENVAIGDVCYFKSDGKFWKMDADAVATIKGMCVMATATILADASGVFLLRGLIRDDTWDWTVAAELWASVTPGNPTETKPSGSGDLLRMIGYAKAADYVWFDPDKTYVELA